jgi:hypothetical protein
LDPHTAARMFRLCMPDVRQPILVPKLLEYLRTAAPSVRIDLVYQSEVMGRLVETREVDLANGLLAQLEAGYFQKLFNDRFVCIVNRQRPRLCRGSITLEQFQSEWHSSVATQGTAISSWSKRLNACELGEKRDFASHTLWALSQPLRARVSGRRPGAVRPHHREWQSNQSDGISFRCPPYRHAALARALCERPSCDVTV